MYILRACSIVTAFKHVIVSVLVEFQIVVVRIDLQCSIFILKCSGDQTSSSRTPSRTLNAVKLGLLNGLVAQQNDIISYL